jgi:triphosphoribosyl-dephospho-CoA synthetase
MTEAIGSNAHRGYIFLSGLTLMASVAPSLRLRDEVRRFARLLLGDPPTRRVESNGALVRDRHGLGGIHREAFDGLPSVFEHGLPALERARRDLPNSIDRQLHYVMAVLMQAIEDTTAVHRCGPAGLERLRSDGRALQRLIEDDHDYLPWLVQLNDEYRRLRLTMGGVADCLALTVALEQWLGTA